MRRAALALTAALLVLLAGCDYNVSVRPVPTTTRPAPTSTATPTTTTPTTTTAPTTTSAVPTTAPSITVSPAPTTTTTTTSAATTTTPPANTTAPSVGASTAAAKFGWGKPTAGDEFNGTAVDRSRWGLYDGPGHVGNGRRDPDQITVADGLLTITGDTRGNTGGMAWKDGQYRGGWEARIRVPRGDHQYSAVALLWPDAEDWPVGGEVDFFETRTDSPGTSFFLHYGRDNRQTQARTTVDITQFHNYAVRWDASCIVGYVDAREWFRDCNTAHLPPRAAHLCLQLDWFPKGTAPRESSMQVDWVKQYPI